MNTSIHNLYYHYWHSDPNSTDGIESIGWISLDDADQQFSNLIPATVTRSATGDGSTTGFTVTSGVTVNSVLVTENGVLQKPTTDYTVSSTTLTFAAAPAAGVQIVIRELTA